MWRNFLITAACLLATNAPAQPQFAGLGREATPAEIKAWDIDVRADFKGLPTGAGSVAKGADVWDGKCASCHGTFGESNQVFAPLVGGTTKEDMTKGRVAAMTNGSAPYRTTLMKVSQLSTLWDYINRAMPWNAPKSLSTDEVYAVTAHLLNLGGIVPDDFVLSNQNIADVQATLPNRNGKTMRHGLWHVNGKPDVNAVACMTNCGTGQVTSALPDYARNAHGNLAEQNRSFGAYRGIDTTQAPSSAPVLGLGLGLSPQIAPNSALAKASKTASDTAATVDVKPLLNKHSCTACHGMTSKLLGPAFSEIAKKYTGKTDATTYLTQKIKQGGQGLWGAIAMPAQGLPAQDAVNIAQWLAAGAK